MRVEGSSKIIPSERSSQQPRDGRVAVGVLQQADQREQLLELGPAEVLRVDEMPHRQQSAPGRRRAGIRHIRSESAAWPDRVSAGLPPHRSANA